MIPTAPSFVAEAFEVSNRVTFSGDVCNRATVTLWHIQELKNLLRVYVEKSITRGLPVADQNAGMQATTDAE